MFLVLTACWATPNPSPRPRTARALSRLFSHGPPKRKHCVATFVACSWGFLLRSSSEQCLAEAAAGNLFFYLSSLGVCSVLQLKLPHTLVKHVYFYGQRMRHGDSGACNALAPHGIPFGARLPRPTQLAGRVGGRKAKGTPGRRNSKIGNQELSALQRCTWV